ncbi:MAG: amidohydrolase [Bacteroidota bacterium]
MNTRAIYGIGLCLCLIGCGPSNNSADLILINGKIVTVDEAMPEAAALAVKSDTIMALGSVEAIEALRGPETEVIDLEGNLAIPGFIEGHAHFLGLGNAQMILGLAGTSSWQEIVDMVEAAVAEAEPGEWITGRGWHQEKWDTIPEGVIDGVPTHHALSAISPDNPVLLRHASGHAAFANALALQLGRVSSETPNPPGGEIVHDVVGDPTGLLREKAQNLVSNAYQAYLDQRTPEQIEADAREMVKLASEVSLAAGITSFQDAGASFEDIDFLKGLVDEGALPIRLYIMIRGESFESLERISDYYLPDYGDHRLNVRSIKHAIDGALGPHGAWLLAPYEDMPESAGLNLHPVEELVRTSEIALENGFQMNIHAIGDRANKEVLDIYADLFAAHPDKSDLRWRIEHAQHLHPDDVPRMAELGVIASMQGVHATSDGPWVLKRLGEKRAEEGAYVWQDLWNAGVVVTNGTDAPVEGISALESYYATVSRRLKDGSVFYEDQRLSRLQALKSYTINNAYAAFEEDIKGTLEVGKLADITVLSKDILDIPEEEILDTEVVYTIVGGEVAYSNASE